MTVKNATTRGSYFTGITSPTNTQYPQGATFSATETKANSFVLNKSSVIETVFFHTVASGSASGGLEIYDGAGNVIFYVAPNASFLGKTHALGASGLYIPAADPPLTDSSGFSWGARVENAGAIWVIQYRVIAP